MKEKSPCNYLEGARVYLSGPMDFVASREREKRYGWRNRVGQYLSSHGAIVLDPWNKPDVKNLHEYGEENENSIEFRDAWSFENTEHGARARGECAHKFWETLHIDLRMVDICDFVIAYCPTNIYSVGTPHEITIARQQRKPVLFVSPPVEHSALEKLFIHLGADAKGLALLNELKHQVPIKQNPHGVPSLWYMPLIGAHNFFDGFGFGLDGYSDLFGWKQNEEPDRNERNNDYKRPLIPFLESLANGKCPKKWDHKLGRMVPDDDWLLLDISLHN